jgi:hypothetical protein
VLGALWRAFSGPRRLALLLGVCLVAGSGAAMGATAVATRLDQRTNSSAGSSSDAIGGSSSGIANRPQLTRPSPRHDKRGHHHITSKS